MAPHTDGGWDVFFEQWVSGEDASYGTGGITIAADTLTATMLESAFAEESQLYHALNRNGVTYVVTVEA